MPNAYTPFQRGVAVLLYFRNRPFTIQDLADYFQVDYRSAMRMKEQIERVVPLQPAGYAEKLSYIHGPAREKFRIAEAI